MTNIRIRIRIQDTKSQRCTVDVGCSPVWVLGLSVCVRVPCKSGVHTARELVFVKRKRHSWLKSGFELTRA